MDDARGRHRQAHICYYNLVNDMQFLPLTDFTLATLLTGLFASSRSQVAHNTSDLINFKLSAEVTLPRQKSELQT